MPAARFIPVLALVTLFAGPLAAGAQSPPLPAPGSSSAPAIPPHHHRHRHRDPFMRALRTVTLTPAQQQQIATFRDQTQKANANADSATRQANTAKLHDQIMGVLTPDQKTQVTSAIQHDTRRFTEGTTHPGAMRPGVTQPSPAATPTSP